MSDDLRPVDRVLIVNADDFGLSDGVNRGIAEAHEQGIVTSATLLVRAPAATGAAAYARANPALSLGLHLDLGEWEYRDDAWHARYEVVDLDDADAVEAELDRQLSAFQSLVGRPPTHIDSHQHVHRNGSVLPAVRRASARLGVPVRGERFAYEGAFYGQDARGVPVPAAITPDSLVGIIEALPTGITELGCHPGLDDDLDTAYRIERRQEVDTLCDPGVRAAIAEAGVALRSFHDV